MIEERRRIAPGSRFFSAGSSVDIRTGFQRYDKPVFDESSKTAPCRAGCPAGHDIAQALFLLSKGRSDLADKAFRDDSPFPSITGRVCYHPCEAACNRVSYDGAVGINALERYFSEGASDDAISPAEVFYSESIGVIGSGPSGLTVAYHLAKLGYKTVVYEANDKPGGVLSYGIPGYRLPAAVVEGEMDRLRRLGIVFECGVRVGETIAIEELQRQHAALFVGVGLSRARPFSVPLLLGATVMTGLELLRQAVAGSGPSMAGRVLVVGGGDVAMDAARTSIRLGASQVVVLSPEQRDQMPAHAEEIAEGESEGIEIRCGWVPVRISRLADGLCVDITQVQSICRHSDGQRSFQYGEESQSVEFDHVIAAVGQQSDLAFLSGASETTDRLKVSEWGETKWDRVFAGGDVVGTYNVVNAIGSGKRAAIGIDVTLRSLPIQDLKRSITVGSDGAISMNRYRTWRQGQLQPLATSVVPFDAVNLDYFPHVEPQKPGRINFAAQADLPSVENGFEPDRFAEVRLPLSAEAAAIEASRCFNCGMCNMCGNCYRFCPDSSVVQVGSWGFRIDLDHCKGCGICVQECPRSAMSMIPERE